MKRITNDKSEYLEMIILNLIREMKVVSRMAINRVAGIRLSTITEVTRRLLRKGIIIECGQLKTSDARHGKKDLMLNPGYRNLVGIEVESTEVAAVLTDFCGNILAEERKPIDASFSRDAILNVIFSLTEKMMAVSPDREIIGIGVATIGMIDMQNNTILFASNLPDWKDVQLKSILEKRYSLPIIVADQVMAKLNAEKWFSDADIQDSAVFVDIGDPFGVSIIHNRQMLKSIHGSIGEIGHFCVSPEHKLCTCGNAGCMQTVASAGVILKSVQSALDEGTMSLLNAMTHGDSSRLTVPMILQAAEQGDRISENILTNAAFYIGKSISYIVNLLCPELIILGGDLVRGGDYFTNLIMAEVKRETLYLSMRNLRIRKASNPVQGGVLGAVCLVLDDFFKPDLYTYSVLKGS